MKKIKYDLVVWDWNGTLLDDHQVCTQNFNQLVARQNIAPLTPDQFRAIYRHPIMQMYLEVGFKFDETYSYQDLSVDWYKGYSDSLSQAKLFEPVESTLDFLSIAGTKQLVCSALEHQYLVQQIKDRNINHFFEQISGHHDLEAESKVARGVSLIKPYQDSGHKVVMVGDSSHDAELASAVGCDCILLASGHESISRLKANKNASVLSGIEEILDIIAI